MFFTWNSAAGWFKMNLTSSSSPETSGMSITIQDKSNNEYCEFKFPLSTFNPSPLSKEFSQR